MKQYDKEIELLNELENQLLEIDSKLTIIFSNAVKLSEEERIRQFEKLSSENLTHKRIDICCKLLGWENVEDANKYEHFVQLVNKIENSRYSYKKFCKDLEINKIIANQNQNAFNYISLN